MEQPLHKSISDLQLRMSCDTACGSLSSLAALLIFAGYSPDTLKKPPLKGQESSSSPRRSSLPVHWLTEQRHPTALGLPPLPPAAESSKCRHRREEALPAGPGRKPWQVQPVRQDPACSHTGSYETLEV